MSIARSTFGQLLEGSNCQAVSCLEPRKVLRLCRIQDAALQGKNVLLLLQLSRISLCMAKQRPSHKCSSSLTVQS